MPAALVEEPVKSSEKCGRRKQMLAVVQKHFLLLKNLHKMHSMVVMVKGYVGFLLYYTALQALTISSNLSLLVLVFIFREDFDEAFFGNSEENGDFSKLASAGSHVELTGTLIGVIIGFALLQLAGKLAPFLASLLLDALRSSLQVEQAIEVVRKVFELPHDSMLSTPTGEFAQLIGKIFMMSMGGVPVLYKTVFPVAVEFMISTTFIALVYGWPAVLQVGLFAIHTVVTYMMAGRRADDQQESMKALMGEWGKIMAVAGNHEVALYFGQVKREIATARASFEVIQVAMAKMVGIDWPSFFQRLMTLFASVGFVSLVFLHLENLTSIASGGDSSLGVTLLERVALCTYFLFNFAVLQLQPWGEAIVALRKAVAEFDSVQQFFERTSETADAKGATDVEVSTEEPPTISFEGVSFSYKDKIILDNVSFSIGSGETLGLAGSSGSGKSTILRLLLRLYKPTAGVIRVNGRDINSQVPGEAVTDCSLRKLVSVVSQNPKLFNSSIRENIAYGAGEEMHERVSDAEILRVAAMAGLDLAAIADDLGDLGQTELEPSAHLMANSDPNHRALVALDKSCGENGAKLSGGQQQRVAIARALLKDGPILVLDEPTTGLDNVVARRLQETLEGLVPAKEQGGLLKSCAKKSKTTIVVTHNLQDLKRATHILYLEEGRIKEEGTFDTLVKIGGVFADQVSAA